MRSNLPFSIRNLPNRIRGAKQEMMHLAGIGMLARLDAVHMRNNEVLFQGLLGRRMVTDVGVQFLVNGFLNTVELEIMNYHDSGTGVAAEATTDTVLGTPTGIARVAGTQSSPSNGLYRTVATITYNNTFAITEHGLFSATTVGTLFDRTKFAALNVVSGDSIQFTYTCTFTAGG